MPAIARRLMTGAVLCSLLLAAACGNDQGSASGPTAGVPATPGATVGATPTPTVTTTSRASATVDPKAWVKRVCGVLTTWQAVVFTVTEAELHIDEDTVPAAIKAELDKALGAAATATVSAVAGVAAAGVPAVRGGDGAAQGTRAGLIEAKAALTTARAGVQRLDSSDNPDFFDQLTTITDKKDADFAGAIMTINKARSAELAALFSTHTPCKAA